MKTRSTLLGLLLGLGLVFLATGVPHAAFAQCCVTPPTSCCTPPEPPPVCCTPPAPPPCCTPPTPPTPPPGHGGGGGRVNVNVHVSSVNVAIANSSASATANAGGNGSGSGGSTVYYGGGGGGGGYSPPMATGMVQLNVEGPRRMRKVAYEATRRRIDRVVIQAVCLDDRQIPHAASQVTPDREIDETYEGELYRCISGTWLQATIASYQGQVDFSSGKSLVCRKNDALVRLADGRVECRPQRPGRDCNERSLLRRYGAGIKILTMTLVETYTAYREEVDRSETSVATTMSLDGGVGGTVY